MPDTIAVRATIIDPSLPVENPLIDDVVNQLDPSVVVIGSADQLSPPVVLRQSL